MFADLAFFSLLRITDPAGHRAYNEWHQLDHRPINLALPGIAWGDRWARPESYAALSRGTGQYALADYLAMYWFRPPVAESVAAWTALGEDSFQWGRGPLIPDVERSLLAFFRPVKGYASPHVLVDQEALPFRPNRGLHVTLTRYQSPHGADTHRAFGHEDRELIPALLRVHGVAGAWTFAFSHPQRHATLPFDETPDAPQGSMRIRLLYLDEDPLAVTPEIAAVEEREGPAAPGAEVLLSTPLKTIIPWQDW
ncbi:hypothetical protein [uncultured Microbacterium sp.]|uniref:hypothetical protein n=1 Tax=uncultured Microbacterium sp. TaxID=191216 RepID=UPI0035CA873F